MRPATRALIALTMLLPLAHTAADDQVFKPFVLASTGESTLDGRTAEVIGALEAAGFEVAGQYSPLPDTNIIVVTDNALQQVASASDTSTLMPETVLMYCRYSSTTSALPPFCSSSSTTKVVRSISAVC